MTSSALDKNLVNFSPVTLTFAGTFSPNKLLAVLCHAFLVSKWNEEELGATNCLCAKSEQRITPTRTVTYEPWHIPHSAYTLHIRRVVKIDKS